MQVLHYGHDRGKFEGIFRGFFGCVAAPIIGRTLRLVARIVLALLAQVLIGLLLAPSDLARKAILAIPNDCRVVVIASARASGVGGDGGHFGSIAESILGYPSLALSPPKSA